MIKLGIGLKVEHVLSMYKAPRINPQCNKEEISRAKLGITGTFAFNPPKTYTQKTM